MHVSYHFITLLLSGQTQAMFVAVEEGDDATSGLYRESVGWR